ncbi:hypothetical protein J4E83_005443 [Alternaria metachromatica]|uniref:uncharacterized protein n=1 Tax=Alternaria metachromatica TaxID=283354 RepID=UPI0020C262CC|nr:uncharacterized protein J4E83_005443 [Alternaria metachromatica]KAI4621080.1 hypothetical protein J4E83_005443 [Alternaria metachromatica]
MPPEFTALIQECTRGSTKASSYLSRLGLLNGFTDPTKPGRPGFKSNDTIRKFWKATNDKVHAIALLYKSRNAIREALVSQRITLDETVNECLEGAGPRIWSDGVVAEFLTTPDVTGALSEALDAESAPKSKNASEFAERGYPRHLIYGDPDDRNKRKGKSSDAAPETEDPKPPTSFMDAVRAALENSKRKQSRSQVGSNPGKASESSVKDRANLTENGMDAQFLHDRGKLGIQLLGLFESQNPERQDVAEMQKVVGHIDMMAVKYSEELREGLESSKYEKYKGALEKWLTCTRTLVEYREATGLSGDGQAILTGFKALPVEKKKAGRPYFMKVEEIRAWRECDSTALPGFCKEVGSMLLKMASFPTLGKESELGMELDELLLGLIPFTTRLMECFLATPPNP